MKKFKFRLERILQYRKLVKDEKAKELLLCRNRLFGSQEKLKELETAFLLNSIEDGALLQAEQLLIINDYQERLKLEIEKQKEEIEVRKKELLEAQEEYVEASKDERMLQILKERKEAEFIAYLEKEDFKNSDEMIVQKLGHKKFQD